MADSSHRLYLDADFGPGDAITLSREESEHATRSLRLRSGDGFELVNGRGTVARAVASRVSAKEFGAEVLDCTQIPRGEGVELCLLAGVVRGPRFDFLIEKATELGADVLAPVISRHSEIRPRGTEKPERWHRIVVAAMKQSRRAWLPRLEPVRTIEDWLQSESEASLWVADPEGVTPKGSLEAKGRCLLLVGPEGGWHESETAAFKDRGAWFISLGCNRLRTETAAIALLLLARDRLHEAFGVPGSRMIP